MTWQLKLSLFVAALAAAPASGYDTRAVSFFDSGRAGQLLGAADVPLAYRVFEQNPPSRGAVVVATGFSETMRRYAEVALDLHRAGYTVILFDHRGQGQSGRMLTDRHKGYVDDFENYVQDLKTVFDELAKPRANERAYLLAHSMGGGVAARYLEEHPGDFRRATLSAPMLKIRMSSWLEVAAEWLMGLCSLIQFDEFYVRGPTPPSDYTSAVNQVTHDAERYEALQVEIARATPDEQVWGPTARWLHQAMNGSARARSEAHKVETPLLILQAGDDVFVTSEAQDDFCARVKHCTVMRFPTAKHEVLLETESIRSAALSSLLSFFAADFAPNH